MMVDPVIIIMIPAVIAVLVFVGALIESRRYRHKPEHWVLPSRSEVTSLAVYYDVITLIPERETFVYSDKMLDFVKDRKNNLLIRSCFKDLVKTFGIPKTHFDVIRTRTFALLTIWAGLLDKPPIDTQLNDLNILLAFQLSLFHHQHKGTGKDPFRDGGEPPFKFLKPIDGREYSMEEE